MTQKEEARLDALGSLALSQDLAEDTIIIALGIAGYKPHGMTQFERASALLDMARELATLTDKRHAVMHFEAATDRKGDAMTG